MTDFLDFEKLEIARTSDGMISFSVVYVHSPFSVKLDAGEVRQLHNWLADWLQKQEQRG